MNLRTSMFGRLQRARARGRGFTLVELLVVIAVVGILISVLLPALAGARATALEVSDTSQMRQIGIAYSAYMIDHEHYLKALRPKIATKLGEHWRPMVGLYEYVDGNREVFRCPTSRSVGLWPLDPQNFAHLKSGKKLPATQVEGGIETYLTDRDESRFTYDPLDQYSIDDPEDLVCDYYFNDSQLAIPTGGGNSQPWDGVGNVEVSIRSSGISGRRINTVKSPDTVVLMCNQFDDIPRYRGGIYFLFGDQSVQWFERSDYLGPDRYGAIGPFYNWGHFYPGYLGR